LLGALLGALLGDFEYFGREYESTASANCPSDPFSKFGREVVDRPLLFDGIRSVVVPVGGHGISTVNPLIRQQRKWERTVGPLAHAHS
jgi:hypothetical protein